MPVFPSPETVRFVVEAVVKYPNPEVSAVVEAFVTVSFAEAVVNVRALEDATAPVPLPKGIRPVIKLHTPVPPDATKNGVHPAACAM